VQPALEMLLDVRRHGGTFFDAGWLFATLGGHSSPAVAGVVQRYLDGLPPDYPPTLRRRVLEAADLLQRAAKASIRHAEPDGESSRVEGRSP